MEILIHLGAAILAFIITILIIPGIVLIAVKKNLFDEINHRKIHVQNTPPFGGIAVFMGMIISTLLFSEVFFNPAFLGILTAGIIMLLIGIKDDLLNIRAKEKLIFQVISALILVFSPGNFIITNLHHLAGFSEIHTITGVLITVLIILMLVNAYNLIDGIDGLAAGLAFTGTLFFGIWFFVAGQYAYSVLALAMAGSLAGFFLFNVFGIKNKLFMGDTGSLFTGIIIAALLIVFNELNISADASVKLNNAPVVSLAVVIVPITDMLRVMAIRTLQGKSPFSADKNHIHHMLLDLFPRHLTVTMILMGTTMFFIGAALLIGMTDINILGQFCILLTAAILFSFLPSFMLKSLVKKSLKNAEIFVYQSNARKVR